MLITNGEPDTWRRVSPVLREDVGNLLLIQQGAFVLPYDLLKSAEARTILNNCDFVLMLNQAPLDRNELAAMYNISDAQCEYITNADSGQGILYTGKTIVPFTNKFPTNTKLYKAMTTKVGEVSLIS